MQFSRLSKLFFFLSSCLFLSTNVSCGPEKKSLVLPKKQTSVEQSANKKSIGKQTPGKLVASEQSAEEQSTEEQSAEEQSAEEQSEEEQSEEEQSEEEQSGTKPAALSCDNNDIADYIYWDESLWGGGFGSWYQIHRARPDGSGHEIIYNTATIVDIPKENGLMRASSATLTLDRENGMLYWRESANPSGNTTFSSTPSENEVSRILRSCPDGSKVEVLFDGLDYRPGPVIVIANRAYWIADGRIRVSNADFTEAETLTFTGSGDTAHDLRADPKGRYLYWIDSYDKNITRINVNATNKLGGDLEILVEETEPLMNIDSYTIDFQNSKIAIASRGKVTFPPRGENGEITEEPRSTYWTVGINGTSKKILLDASNVTMPNENTSTQYVGTETLMVDWNANTFYSPRSRSPRSPVTSYFRYHLDRYAVPNKTLTTINFGKRLPELNVSIAALDFTSGVAYMFTRDKSKISEGSQLVRLGLSDSSIKRLSSEIMHGHSNSVLLGWGLNHLRNYTY